MAGMAELRTELLSDPISRAYSGLTNQQAADNLNTVDRSRERQIIGLPEVFESLDLAEVEALAANQRETLMGLLSMGQIDMQGPNTRATLNSMFGAGSVTRPRLLALQTEAISRGVEIGFGDVHAGDVGAARA